MEFIYAGYIHVYYFVSYSGNAKTTFEVQNINIITNMMQYILIKNFSCIILLYKCI